MNFLPRSFLNWLLVRLPFQAFWQKHMIDYRVPKRLNFWYCFGALALVTFLLQIVSGVFLLFHYTPVAVLNAQNVSLAEASLQRLMHEIPWGWLIRYVHATGTSAFFVVLYAHLWRGLLYGSYKKPRELVWILGVFSFGLLLMEAMSGAILPWNNSSFEAASVLSHLVAQMPWLGDFLATLLRGGKSVSEATLPRVFVLHIVLIPLALTAIFALHIISARSVGSTNPQGILNLPQEETLPFYPYQFLKDAVAIIIFFIIFLSALFFLPEHILLPESLENAANLPQSQFRPAWYFAPFYAILRSISGAFWGAFFVFAAFLCLILLPWLDQSRALCLAQQGKRQQIMWFLLLSAFVGLGICGLQPISLVINQLTLLFAALYFACFLSMPIWSKTPLIKELKNEA